MFVSLPSEGAIIATFHPDSSVKLGELTRVSFGVPFPKNVLFDAKLIKIIVNGQDLPAYSLETTRWYVYQNSQASSIRSVLVNTNVVFIDHKPLKFTIQYGIQAERTFSEMDVGFRTRKQWINIINNKFPKEYHVTEGITEPAVYVTLAPKWLSKCLLKSRFHEIGEIPEWGWFDRSFENYAHTAVNDVSRNVIEKEKINYHDNAEPWLYDRALVLYSVYLRTGKVKWLRHAHRASQFYSRHIDQNGYFDLKKADAKLSYSQSLLLDLILMGDITHIPIIERIALVGKKWPIDYKLDLGFWTERHLAYAVLSILSAWEATGKGKYYEQLNKLFVSTIKMVDKPYNSWEPNHCFLHTMRQHEGWGGNAPVCSPWMSALLSDAFWKYFIHSENVELLKVISGLGDFVVNYGTYESINPRFNYVVPWYLASSKKKYSDSGPFVDIEHSCDVAGLLARAAWAKKRLGESTEVILNKVDEYLRSCEKNLKMWHRPGKNSKKPIWRLSPSRKFNWWFGTNADMSWFLEDLKP